MTVATSHQNQMKDGRSGAAQSKVRFWALTLGSIGVVYGDIGTSPLYALRESVVAAVGSGNPANETVVLGILSLELHNRRSFSSVKIPDQFLRKATRSGGTLPRQAGRLVSLRGHSLLWILESCLRSKLDDGCCLAIPPGSLSPKFCRVAYMPS
jgi:K+ potassium transporter